MRDETTSAPPAPPIPASGTVHWVGTGLSTGAAGLGLLFDWAERVLLWGRSTERAAGLLARLELTGRAGVRALEDGALAAEVRAGDVVVSMLPATEHAGLLRLCAERGAHFACSSYVAEPLAELAADAASTGVVVLTEAGLDPGLDHLLAHRLIQRAREAVGDRAGSVRFTSFCGGLPAVPNDFRYRFSWAPYGVLAALTSPSRYIDEDVERTSVHPWEATRPHRLDGEEFEVYPNRDSLPFIAQYRVPDGWHLTSFVRGTLRNAGWSTAWKPVFETVRTGDEARIRALAQDLAERYPTTDADRDRVVLSVALDVRGADGTDWQGSYVLDLTGDGTHSAMARCVSLPLAFGVTRILDGGLPAGLNRAAESPGEVDRWLRFLDDNGVRSTFQETVGTGPTAPA
ncbi:saccharopine dehydrogenase family protein [Streptomyces sp. H39-S7]|uniref:saccharopine dehydrogenase family protein n=1 Tax=Streptomyces sp. H39-S7 TaxID=3004357 RepID=UPI0022B05598|nr:saccharopine dehydrogenase family protein [Streptomyces sp. H39-S7]MCZ4119965.1 saccharopine dehydrogenase NADP-binding domain-containing protein [Streptomyces sp. H39-S7]